MSFSLIPPEINSALMALGAGSGPMLEAATAWDGLAADLESTATQYQTAITNLTTATWLGGRGGAGAVHRLAAGHRDRGGADGGSGQGRCRRVPDGVLSDGAAAADHRQPGRAGHVGVQQLPRPEHRGDRPERSPEAGHVDPG